MKRILLCCNKKSSRQQKSDPQRLSTMRLENFERLKQKQDQNNNNILKTKENIANVVTLPGQVHISESTEKFIYGSFSNVTLNQKIGNDRPNDRIIQSLPNDPKKEIGIQAGSPLGTVKTGNFKTETTLSITTHAVPNKQFWKNPWKSPKTADNMQTLHGKKDLSPIKKPIAKPNKVPDTILPAVVAPITNKLPPVDKAFLLKLERENSQNHENTKNLKKERPKNKKHRPDMNCDGSSIDQLLEDIDNSSRNRNEQQKKAREKPINRNDVKTMSKETATETSVSSSYGEKNLNTSNVDIYNVDDLVLMDSIEREFFNN